MTENLPSSARTDIYNKYSRNEQKTFRQNLILTTYFGQKQKQKGIHKLWKSFFP